MSAPVSGSKQHKSATAQEREMRWNTLGENNLGRGYSSFYSLVKGTKPPNPSLVLVHSSSSEHHPGIFPPKDFSEPGILPTGTVVFLPPCTFLSNQCLVFESKG